MKYPEISDKIITLKKNDLELRNKLIENNQLGEGYNEYMAELHNHNAEILNEIIDDIGYPTIDKVGKEGNQAAWLVIQHAIGLPDFMKKCALLLEEAVNENSANPIQLAYLMDRITVFEGQAQIYGTQFDWDINGELSPNHFESLAEVNSKRKSLGLNTLDEQTKIMRAQAITENQTPPTDFAKREKQMNEWRRKVGWIK